MLKSTEDAHAKCMSAIETMSVFAAIAPRMSALGSEADTAKVQFDVR
jgi:hypothetical protein